MQVIQQINNNHGTDDWQPIVPFIENNYTQAMAGLLVYDTLMVNPVVDGMNLVTKEGPLVNDRNGVLLLSEASSAYDQLQVGALGVAPADLQGTADALYQAITMSADERQRRGEALVEAIEREDVTQWLLSQMEEIADLL